MSTSISPSTRGDPSRHINWLFFNPANADCLVYSMSVPDDPLHLAVEQLEWIAALKEYFEFRADESTILFWRPNPPLLVESIGSDWIETVHDIESVTRLCQPASCIDELFDESWNSDHVHFIIEAEEEDTDPMAVQERDPELESPLRSMNRRFMEAKRVAPKAAWSDQHTTLQGKPATAIYNGTFVCDTTGQPKVVTIAPPIQIFHPIFQEFLDRINDPEFEPDIEVALKVSRLMPYSSVVHTYEDADFSELRRLLVDLSGGNATPDGIMIKRKGSWDIPLVLLEYRRSIGEGGCDPSIQAAYSLREFIYKDELSGFLDACGCPSFLLAGAGPYLYILGAVHTDKFIVQHLTELYLKEVTPFYETRNYHVAKIFTSLRRARDTLDQYYERISDQIIISPTSTTPRDTLELRRRCFFPHATEFKEYQAGMDAGSQLTEFEYTDVPNARSTNVTFFAQVKSSKRKLAIKFVDRFGMEAHELLANAGMSPQLLYCGTLDGKSDVRNDRSRVRDRFIHGLYLGPLRMVVMDRVEADEMGAWPANAREQTEEAVEKLHNAGFVLGDLRLPNVLFSKGKVFLIDFDWAGKSGEARYPRGLSRNVDWPADPESLELKLIEPDHDLFMLRQCFSK